MLWWRLVVFIGSFLVSILVGDARRDAKWVVTCVYGPHRSSARSAFWTELSVVAVKWNRLWVVKGF